MKQCFSCGGVAADGATFSRKRKPNGRRRFCEACVVDNSAEHAVERRAEIAALRAVGRYQAPKPIQSLPLFAHAVRAAKASNPGGNQMVKSAGVE